MSEPSCNAEKAALITTWSATALVLLVPLFGDAGKVASVHTWQLFMAGWGGWLALVMAWTMWWTWRGDRPSQSGRGEAS